MVDEANVEHASAKDLIAQIESSDPGDDLFDAKVKVLGEYIAVGGARSSWWRQSLPRSQSGSGLSSAQA